VNSRSRSTLAVSQYQREHQDDDHYQPHQSHSIALMAVGIIIITQRNRRHKRSADDPTNTLMLTKVPDSLQSDLVRSLTRRMQFLFFRFFFFFSFSTRQLSDALKAYAPITYLNYLGDGRARVTFEDERGAAAVMAGTDGTLDDRAGASIQMRYTAHVTTNDAHTHTDDWICSAVGTARLIVAAPRGLSCSVCARSANLFCLI
jgi:hypothetical protein